MATSIQNPADAVNAALIRIGYRRQISDLYDGSDAAQLALSQYGQVRDALMRDGDWGFAQRNVPLVLLKQAPANMTYLVPWTNAFPPLPWKFEYEYPADMLRLRAVKPTPIFIPSYDPQPNVWAIDNDNSFNPPQRVILCNVENAICVYSGRVTDPTTWPSDFTEALIDALGESLGPALSGMETTQLAAAEGTRDTATAKMEQG